MQGAGGRAGRHTRSKKVNSRGHVFALKVCSYFSMHVVEFDALRMRVCRWVGKKGPLESAVFTMYTNSILDQGIRESLRIVRSTRRIWASPPMRGAESGDEATCHFENQPPNRNIPKCWPRVRIWEPVGIPIPCRDTGGHWYWKSLRCILYGIYLI
eukprot:9211885-Pyramimonas_sp.AAC.1